LLRKTINGGTSWTELSVNDFAFGQQPNLLLEAISPNDPDIVYARVLGARAPQGDDLYRSDDGGASWTLVAQMHGIISSVLVRNDDSVLIGSATACAEDYVGFPDGGVPNKGCVLTSPDGTAGTFTTPDIEPKIACLNERPTDNTLFGCAGNWDPDNFALGTSLDNANSWQKVVRFSEISGPLQCDAGTKQHTCETMRWPSLCVMLGICASSGTDGGVNASDAGVVVPDPPEGCGCQATSKSNTTAVLSLFTLVLLFGFRRRSRSS
jgi:MYXO-CTERM domain-containing protein